MRHTILRPAWACVLLLASVALWGCVPPPEQPPIALATAPAAPVEPDPDVPDRVFFDTNSAQLGAEALAVVERQAAWIVRNGAKVSLEAYSDPRGSAELNRQLAQRRAQAVRERLISLGVNPAQIVNITAHGKERVLASGRDAEAMRQNRAVVIVVLG